MPNVSLTRQMQEYAEAQVASGAYANISEVVRAGMRKLMEDERAELLALREELAERMKAEPVELDYRRVLLGD